MRRAYHVLLITFLFHLIFSPNTLYADLNNNWVINHEMAEYIETLKEKNGYSSEDFNACQITWTTRKLDEPSGSFFTQRAHPEERSDEGSHEILRRFARQDEGSNIRKNTSTPQLDTTDPHSQFEPHEITFYYENQEIIKLVNSRDGNIESIQELGLNCLEFNNYLYLFFDTLNDETRSKFNLTDLSYVIYSADKGSSWSQLQSLHQFSIKAKFSIPSDRFRKYVKIFGDRSHHALSIYNLRDETTYLLSPELNILKTVPVYNRISDFNDPSDFTYYKNILYLARGSCDKIKGRIQCPPRTYLETSRDFGHTWEKEILPVIKKSYFLILNNSLHHFYFKSCSSHWFNIIPALNYSRVCGYIQVRKLNILGQWDKPKTLIKTVDKLLSIYNDQKPILVWNDFRFHKSRMCGYIPFIGCVDSDPFRGPMVTYAGTLDINDWQIDESIIEYKIR